MPPASAQEADAEPAKHSVPSTTADPKIPVEHLELLLKPLTKEELVVEADGWRDLLKACLQRNAEVRIGAAVDEDAGESAGSGEKPPPGPAKPPARAADASEDAGANGTESSEDLADLVPQLLEEKANLIRRLDVVLDELEAKGGEVESYRQYISAQTAVAVESVDAKTLWAVFSGWLTSEQGGQRWAWNLLKFLVILSVFYTGASFVGGLLRRAVSRVQGASQLMVDFAGKFVKQLVLAIGLIVALAALEIDITPLLAAVGAAGFVVAFALQDTLSNFASGILILAYRPFDVGDVIEAADVSGVVDSVSLFSTHIRTFDNKMMIVPNNDIWGGTITNATASDTRRVDMVFGIGYDDDIEKAKSLLESIIGNHELVLKEPVPVVRVHELADSSVNFVCRPWTRTADYWTVYWDITQAVKQRFDENSISIPFPQRDIHVYQESRPSADRA